MSSCYDTVRNPIPKTGSILWARPTLAQLQEQIDNHPNPQEKALMSTLFVMTINACHDLVENEIHMNKEILA